MDDPLFSVLIANYNNGSYLLESIESVRKQSYSHWEIIIVDDGSTDNSQDIYRQLLKDKRIHIYYNQQNKGCSYTKHQCVIHSQGVFCGFLDPDDVLLPNALSVTVNALLNDSNIVLTFSRHYVCDEKLNRVADSRLLRLKDGESYFEHHDYQAEVFAGFRKKAYCEMGGLDTTIKRGVDADLYFRLEERGRIKIINEFTYLYRRLPNSLVANNERMTYWNLIVRHNTCIRRGLPVEQFSLCDFHEYVEREIDLRLSQNEQALSSRAYKLGKIILKPFSIWRK